MQERLAEQLLARIMGWEEGQVKRELPPLLLLAEVKYDQYHQFGPGMRFLERLVGWLRQMPRERRDLAYALIRDKLIFLSSAEMYSLIGMTYSDVILPVQREIVATELTIPQHRVVKIEAEPRFKSIRARTLCVGLSDGSQIGILRRLNPGVIEHERALLSYDASEERIAALIEEHVKELKKAGVEDPQSGAFELFVLVDDFTASGTSFIRSEVGNEQTIYKGKIAAFLEKLQSGPFKPLLPTHPIKILVVFYVATSYALNRIREGLSTFAAENDVPHTVEVRAVHEINDAEVAVCSNDPEVDSLLRDLFVSYQEEVLDNPHYKKGDCTEPHRGFNRGDLALVLYHNCPNNSIPQIWHDSLRNYALFPRTSRHGVQ